MVFDTVFEEVDYAIGIAGLFKTITRKQWTQAIFNNSFSNSFNFGVEVRGLPFRFKLVPLIWRNYVLCS